MPRREQLYADSIYGCAHRGAYPSGCLIDILRASLSVNALLAAQAMINAKEGQITMHGRIKPRPGIGLLARVMHRVDWNLHERMIQLRLLPCGSCSWCIAREGRIPFRRTAINKTPTQCHARGKLISTRCKRRSMPSVQNVEL